MIAHESLDHQPQAVTLERLPDGTALLWLRKDIRQTPQDEAVPGWECNLVTVHLTAAQAAQETVESVQANFDTWWSYTPPTPEPDERTRIYKMLSVLEQHIQEIAAAQLNTQIGG